MSRSVRLTLKNGHLSKVGVHLILSDLFFGLRVNINDVNRYYPDVASSMCSLYNRIKSLNLK